MLRLIKQFKFLALILLGNYILCLLQKAHISIIFDINRTSNRDKSIYIYLSERKIDLPIY